MRIYDQLLQFPLFQGMSHDDLEIVAGHTRLGFTKVGAGKPVQMTGDACSQLYFLINGVIRIETFSEDRQYSVVEQMSAPYILQQEAIFGYFQRYTHDFTALTDANFITIDKEEVVRLAEEFLVLLRQVLVIVDTRQGAFCTETIGDQTGCHVLRLVRRDGDEQVAVLYAYIP